jgi:gliding motility-associated-like protein
LPQFSNFYEQAPPSISVNPKNLLLFCYIYHISKNKMRGVLFFILLILLILRCSIAIAQVQIFQYPTPEELVTRELIGTGVQVFNVVYNGSREAIGYYTRGAGGPAPIFPRGVILCTGRLRDVPGPNTNTNAPAPNRPNADYNNGAPGDPQLTAIIGARTFNAATLEFDFIPITDSISFNFIFASEEYTEYVDKRYNDVFAFLISGPGIPPPGINIALVPGTNTPVSINSINHLRNTGYYIDNEYIDSDRPAPYNIEYDGFTTSLTAKAKIPYPCQTYRLKIAIADVADAYWDSAVLLESGSFSSPTYAVEVSPGKIGSLEQPTTYEGCNQDIRFIFRRPPGASLPEERIPLQLGGSAIRGQDYTFERDYIHFRSGALTDTLYLNPLLDSEQNPNLEEIVLSFRPPLTCQPIVAKAYIAEPDFSLRLFPAQDTLAICARAGQNAVTLQAQAYGGRLNDVTYRWEENGNVLPQNTPTINLTPNQSAQIKVKASYPVCAFPEREASLFLKAYTPSPNRPFSVSLRDTVVCPGNWVTLQAQVDNSVGPLSYLWDNGSTSSSAAYIVASNREARVRVKDQCDSADARALLQILQSRLNSRDLTICRGQEVNLALALQPAQAARYQVEWYNSQNNRVGLGNVFTARPQTSTYFIARVAGYPCVQDTVFIQVQPPLQVTPPNDTAICAGQTVFFQPAVAGGDGASFSYRWEDETNGVFLGSAPALRHLPAATTIYKLTVNNNCNTPQTFRIKAAVIPATLSIDSIAFLTPHPQCPGREVKLRAYVSGGSGNYTYAWQNGIEAPDSSYRFLIFQNIEVGLTVKDGCNQKEAQIIAQTAPPLHLTLEDTLVCKGLPFSRTVKPEGGQAPYHNWQWEDSLGNLLSAEATLNWRVYQNQLLRVWVSDACNSRSSAAARVNIFPELAATSGLKDTSICYGQKLSYVAAIQSGAPPYRFAWTDAPSATLLSPDSIFSFTPSQSQRLRLKVQDRCAAFEQEAFINVTPPTLAWKSVVFSPGPVVCRGQTIRIEAQAKGGSQTYVYIFPDTQNATGRYSQAIAAPVVLPIAVTDGCQNLDTTLSFTHYPTIEADFSLSDTAICEGESVWLTALPSGGKLPYRYAWQDSSWQGGVISQDSLFSFAPRQTSFLRLQVEEACGNTTITPWKKVRLKPLPQIQLIPDTTLCAGTCVPLRYQVAPPQAILSWSPPVSITPGNHPVVCPSQTTHYTLNAMAEGCYAQARGVTVRIAPRPRIRITSPAYAFCQGQDTVKLQSETRGGTPPYRYQWFPAAGLSDIVSPNVWASPKSGVTYTLQVRDALGCSAQDSTKITVYPLPVADAGKDTAICALGGQSVRLLGRGVFPPNTEYDYRWLPEAGLNNARIAEPLASPWATTTYTLTLISRPYGCVSRPQDSASRALATVTVKVIPLPEAKIGGGKPICLGDSLQLEAKGELADAYYWFPAQGINEPASSKPKVSPEHSRWYYLTVKREGCLSHADSVYIAVKPRPTFKAVDNAQICPGDTVRLSCSVSGAPGPYQYLWQPRLGLLEDTTSNPLAFPRRTTTYYLSVRANGCEGFAKDSVIVAVLPLPSLTLPDTFRVYEGEPAILPAQYAGTPAAVFLWEPSHNLNDPTLLTPVINPQESKTYTLKAFYGPCSAQKSVYLQVIRKFKVFVEADKLVICQGDTVTLKARKNRTSGTVIYRWSPINFLSAERGAQVLAFPKTTQTYTVWGTDSGYTDSAKITIKVYPRPKAGFEVTQSLMCDSVSVQLIDKSENAEFWRWHWGDDSPVSNEKSPKHVYRQAGEYWVRQIVRNSGGCEDKSVQSLSIRLQPYKFSEAIYSEPPPGSILYLPHSAIRFWGENADNQIKWLWLLGDGAQSQAPSPTHTYTEPGLYYVELWQTDPQGCVRKLTLGRFRVTLPDLELPNVFTPNQDGVNDFWEPIYQGSEDWSYQIYDRWGIKVYESAKGGSPWRGTNEQGQPLVEGTYFYIVFVGDKTYKGSVTLLR